MEVACSAIDDCLTLWNAFLEISPFPSELYGSFHRLCAGVDRKNHVIPKHLGNDLSEATKDAVIERARGKSQFLCLFDKSCDDFWVAMAL